MGRDVATPTSTPPPPRPPRPKRGVRGGATAVAEPHSCGSLRGLLPRAARRPSRRVVHVHLDDAPSAPNDVPAVRGGSAPAARSRVYRERRSSLARRRFAPARARAPLVSRLAARRPVEGRPEGIARAGALRDAEMAVALQLARRAHAAGDRVDGARRPPRPSPVARRPRHVRLARIEDHAGETRATTSPPSPPPPPPSRPPHEVSRPGSRGDLGTGRAATTRRRRRQRRE